MTPVAPASVLGVDAGSGTLREADHLLAELVRRLGLPETVVGCTHFVRTPLPHVAVSLTLPGSAAFELTALPHDVGAVHGRQRQGSADLIEGAVLAAAQPPRSGRAAIYPGVARLNGTLTVAQILERSAIERVTVLMNQPPPPDARVLTRAHVRPEWQDGVLTLLTQQAGEGMLAPYEVPNPTPCCAGHE